MFNLYNKITVFKKFKENLLEVSKGETAELSCFS